MSAPHTAIYTTSVLALAFASLVLPARRRTTMFWQGSVLAGWIYVLALYRSRFLSSTLLNYLITKEMIARWIQPAPIADLDQMWWGNLAGVVESLLIIPAALAGGLVAEALAKRGPD